MKKTLFVLNKESKEDWLRTSIFYSICNIDGKVCNLIINRGIMKTWWSYEEYSYQNKVQRIKSKIDSPILNLEANV